MCSEMEDRRPRRGGGSADIASVNTYNRKMEVERAEGSEKSPEEVISHLSDKEAQRPFAELDNSRESKEEIPNSPLSCAFCDSFLS